MPTVYCSIQFDRNSEVNASYTVEQMKNSSRQKIDLQAQRRHSVGDYLHDSDVKGRLVFEFRFNAVFFCRTLNLPRVKRSDEATLP